MLKKYIASIALLLLLKPAYAETCPTPKELANGTFQQKGWQALNLNSGEPLSASEWKEIKPHLKQFFMARWVPDAPEGTGQCYYNDSKSELELEVYFAKNTFSPDKTRGNWRTVSYNISQCETSEADCRYQDHA